MKAQALSKITNLWQSTKFITWNQIAAIKTTLSGFWKIVSFFCFFLLRTCILAILCIVEGIVTGNKDLECLKVTHSGIYYFLQGSQSSPTHPQQCLHLSWFFSPERQCHHPGSPSTSWTESSRMAAPLMMPIWPFSPFPCMVAAQTTLPASGEYTIWRLFETHWSFLAAILKDIWMERWNFIWCRFLVIFNFVNKVYIL